MPRAPAIQKLNPQTIRKWRKRCDSSLYTFQKFGWRDEDITPEVHLPLLLELEKVPLRYLVCAWRGMFKSSCVRAAFTWIALKNPNWAVLLIMNRYENAQKFLKFIDGKFRWGPTSGLLQEMYADRLEEFFEKSTQENLYLTRTDPNAQPFLSIAGMDSKLESGHWNHLVCEDLEGADEDKAKVPGKEGRRFLFNRTDPLLQKPAENPIWLVGTPHGDDPLVWRVRDLVENAEKGDMPDNPLNWRMFWKEALDSDGNSRWEERFPLSYYRTLQSAAALSQDAKRKWDQQYMLRRKSVGAGFFDIIKIQEGFYELEQGRLVTYPSLDLRPEKVKGGKPLFLDSPKRKSIDLAYCWSYLHMDFQHKNPADRIHQAESLWAIIPVYVAPDMHAFVVDPWIEDVALEVALKQFFLMYRRHAPRLVTIDPIGAQVWMKTILKMAEKNTYGNLVSLPTPWRPKPKRLGRPSNITQSADEYRMDKESHILAELEVPFNMMWLHLHHRQERLLEHLGNVGTGAGFMDGADALSQHPPVSDAPLSPEKLAAIRLRKEITTQLQMVEPVTGYVRQWAS